MVSDLGNLRQESCRPTPTNVYHCASDAPCTGILHRCSSSGAFIQPCKPIIAFRIVTLEFNPLLCRGFLRIGRSFRNGTCLAIPKSMFMKAAKERLIVIGNGMAGARVVEEILKRAPDRFDIVMFGAEPYGNYNRILLSNVLNGSQDGHGNLHESAVVVSRERCPVACRCSGRRTSIANDKSSSELRCARKRWPTVWTPHADADAGIVEEPYDRVIIATGSAAVRAADGRVRRSGDVHVSHHRRLFPHRRLRKGLQARRGNRRRSSRAGSRARASDARCRSDGPRGCAAADGRAARSGSRRHSAQDHRSDGNRVLCNTITTRIARTGTNGTSRVTHLEFKDGTTLDTDMVVVSAGIRPITEIATASGLDRETGHRLRRSNAHQRSRHLCRRRMRRTSRPALRPGRSDLGAGAGPRRRHHRYTSGIGVPRFQTRYQTKSDGRGAGLDGRNQARESQPTKSSSIASRPAAFTRS